MTGSVVRGDVAPPAGIAWLDVSAGRGWSHSGRARTGPLGLQISPLPQLRGTYMFKGARLRGARCVWSASTVNGVELHRPPRRLVPGADAPLQLLVRWDCAGSVFEHSARLTRGVLWVLKPAQEVREQFPVNAHLFTLDVVQAATGVDRHAIAEMLGRKYALTAFQGQLLRSAAGLLLTGAEELSTANGIAGVDRYLSALAGLLLRTTPRPVPGDGAQVQSVRDRTDSIVAGQFADPSLTPSAIATQLSMSLRQLYRAFDGTESPAARIRRCRLDRAAQMLAGDNVHTQVERVAQECGFTSAEYFSRAFRREFGLSPRAYRSAHLDGAFPS